MKILISGATGFVGSALIKLLTKNGHEVTRLVRHAPHYGRPEIGWDPSRGVIDKEHLEGMDVVDKIKGVATTSKAGHQDVPQEDVVIESVSVDASKLPA